jgi:hypothetical protein
MAGASETFNGPSLNDLIQLARQGHDTAPAAINRMLQALQSQLISGPLGDFSSGAVDGNGFVVEVQNLEASYEQNVDQQLSPEFPNVDELLKLQGQRMVSDAIALNQLNTVGLISDTDLGTDAQTAFTTLTAGPIFSLGTPISAYISATNTFESNLNTLVQSLSSSATTPLTPAEVSATVLAEASAYQTNLHTGLQVTHPNISSMVDTAVINLGTAASGIASDSSSDAQTALTNAIATFDAAILGTTGLFGSQGIISQATAGGRPLTANLTVSRPATTLGSVSGTANFGGDATLTATLTLAGSSQAVSGVPVRFTLDGAFAGFGVTDSNGVATVTGIPTSQAVGTDSAGVVAYFAGDINGISSTGSGDLVVSQSATSLTNVSGTASFGGTATLTATLTSSVTGQGISGETVSFSLSGTSVGSATTNSSGVATLSGVATTATAGTHTGAVVASFAGDANHGAAPNGTGDLVVSKAATSLGSVSGTASFGGTATLTATLTSSVTNQGVSGESVSFTLDGTSVGSATTNSSGVATLTGVATTDAVGTHTGVVVASFAGDANYVAAPNASGDLVVSKAATAVASVAGTASFGGTATLTATLTSTVTNHGISGESVSFTLDGTSVGSATTDSSGVATLTGVATSDPVGTHTGVVVASFAGDTNYVSSSGTGNLVVSQAGTTLTAVSGTATFGGTATLTATLDSSVTNQPISGQTVTFTLDGTSIGSATTDTTGVATLSGVATSDPVGTHTGAVVASYAATTNYGASMGTGNLVVSQAATALGSVAGTASFGGTATLTATLTSTVTSKGIEGESVTFMLDGTAVGSATTDANGVATLTGVATSDPVGTHTGVVVANFAGDTNYVSSSGTGDLVVSQAATALNSVGGTASFGGTATLVATLTSTVTGQPIAGETVSFTLDGTAVGTAMTDTTGIATLTGVATSDPVGTHTGAVVASFAGDTNYVSSSGTGDLVVSQAATALTSVSGTASFGGTATLVATLTSSVTGQPIAGETVSFTLDGTAVGTAMTDTTGIATLTGVATSDPVGTDPGGVVANFAGDTNYLSSSGTGDLVVSQAATALASVSGTASFGGTATLVATLTSSVTDQPIAGETVSFTLDGTAVGTAMTDTTGVATLTGVATSDPVGTDPGGVVASFAGDTNYLASTGTGDLVVSQAATTLTSVSGTAVFGGPATLMATLMSSVTGQPIAGAIVIFTLDGTVVGSVATGTNGVATLSGVPTSDPVGTDPGGVVATFAGDTSYLSSTGTGDLVVSQAPTAFTNVAGTATGGMATLTATLTSSVTGMGIMGETVTFTLDGTVVGTMMTDSSGIATLSGVPTQDPVGTYPNAVLVSFAGDTDYLPSSAMGTLTVS